MNIVTDKAISFWIHVNENSRIWLKQLCNKYPEYLNEFWIEKYLDQDLAPCVPEISLFAYKELLGLDGYWCKNAKIEELIKLVENKVNVIISLKNNGRKPHSYICIGYFKKRKIFILDDVARGGIKQEIAFEEITQRVKGNPIFLSGLLKDNNEMKIVKKILNKRLLYFT